MTGVWRQYGARVLEPFRVHSFSPVSHFVKYCDIASCAASVGYTFIAFIVQRKSASSLVGGFTLGFWESRSLLKRDRLPMPLPSVSSGNSGECLG